MNDVVLLDSYIIFPYNIRVSGEVGDWKEIVRYANLSRVALGWGYAKVLVRDDKDIRDATVLLRDIANEYNFPPLEVTGTSMGLQLLHNESTARVRIILILTLTLIGFTFYGMFATFYDKIQSNKKIYGIYQMNGCSLGLILIPFLIEIAVVPAPAVFVC